MYFLLFCLSLCNTYKDWFLVCSYTYMCIYATYLYILKRRWWQILLVGFDTVSFLLNFYWVMLLVCINHMQYKSIRTFWYKKTQKPWWVFLVWFLGVLITPNQNVLIPFVILFLALCFTIFSTLFFLFFRKANGCCEHFYNGELPSPTWCCFCLWNL